VVLAGGRGRRLGGAKAVVPLAGRPMIAWPLAALRSVAAEVAVVAKADTELPPLSVPVWIESVSSRHPRHGIVEALRRADGRSVVVLAVDLPLVREPLLRALIGAAGVCAVACDEGKRVQPLCGVYGQSALAVLESAPADEALVATVERLGPAVVDAGAALLNVNTPADLERAAVAVSRRAGG
jgi:molybdopterin-guanine dinucleotide biosynthesis protein A